jgi:hypothetical protein
MNETDKQIALLTSRIKYLSFLRDEYNKKYGNGSFENKYPEHETKLRKLIEEKIDLAGQRVDEPGEIEEDNSSGGNVTVVIKTGE